MLKVPLTRAAITLSFAALAGCASTPQPAPVSDTIASTPNLTTMTRLIEQAGLTETLRSGGPYTVFAPSDEAFKAVPAEQLAKLAGDRDAMRAVLNFHVLPGRIAAAQVPNGTAKSVQGANLALARAGTFVTVEDAVVQRADVTATNGVIHVVDRVLMPPKR